jgi:hypothetical protein
MFPPNRNANPVSPVLVRIPGGTNPQVRPESVGSDVDGDCHTPPVVDSAPFGKDPSGNCLDH